MKKKTQEQSGRKRRKKAPFIIGGVLIVAAVGFFALNGASTRQTEGAAVAVVPVSKKDIQELVETSGTVVSRNKKTFFSPVNASIKMADFEVGDTVSSGDTMVTFDLENLEKDNKKAQMTSKSNELGYQDTVSKSNKAVQNKEEAQRKADLLEPQVEAWKQYVEDLNRQIAQVTKDAQTNAVQTQQSAAAQAKAAQDAAVQKAQEEINGKIAKLNTQIEELTSKRTVISDKLEEAVKTLTQLQQQLSNAQYKKEILSQNYDQVKASGEDSSKIAEASENLKAQIKVVHDLEDVQVPKAQQAVNTLNTQITEKFNTPLEELKTQAAELSATDVTADLNTGSYNNSSSGTADTAVNPDTTELQLELQSAQATLQELQSDLASNKSIAQAEAASLSEDAKEQLQVNNNLQELEGKTIQELIDSGKKGISAEFTGVVSDSKVLPGTTVVQGQELFTLQSTTEVDVNVTLSKYDFEKVKTGQKAVITIGAREYEGTVNKISHIAVQNEKGTSVIKCSVGIDNPDSDIFLGVDAKVSIRAAEESQVLVIPVEAVNTGNDGSFCYVLKDGMIQKCSVVTGISSDDYTQISSGLEFGDEVIPDIGDYQEGMQAEALSVSEETQASS